MIASARKELRRSPNLAGLLVERRGLAVPAELLQDRGGGLILLAALQDVDGFFQLASLLVAVRGAECGPSYRRLLAGPPVSGSGR